MKYFYLVFLVALIIINQSDVAKARQLRYLMLSRNGEETEKEHESTEADKKDESKIPTNVDNQNKGATQNLTESKTENEHKAQINTETKQSKQILLEEVNEEVVTQSNVSNTQYEQPAPIIQAVPAQEPVHHKKRFGQDSNHQKSYTPQAGVHRPQAKNSPNSHTFKKDNPRPNGVGFPHGRYDYNQDRPNIKPIAIPREIYLQRQKQGVRFHYDQKLVNPVQKKFGQQPIDPHELLQPLLIEPIYDDYQIERTWHYD